MTVLKQCITRACCWIAKVCAQGSPLRQAMVVCERGLLAFPLLVVLLVTAVFVCGGVVSGWQAPVCLLMTLAFMLLQRQYAWKCRLGGAGLFIAFLCLVWVLLGCFLVSSYDNMAYHYPKIFLLLKGWNPFYQNTVEDLVALTGQPIGSIRTWHILFIVNTMHIFNAAVARFLMAPFTANYYLVLFLLIPGLGSVWRMMRALNWTMTARVTSIVAMLCVPTLPDSGFRLFNVVDIVVCISCLGMLASMVRILKGEKCFISLWVFSLWMITVKQSALISCFVFWLLFSAVLLWEYRQRFWRTVGMLAVQGGALMLFMFWICSSPYISSWRTYGHPFYPAYTSDVEKFPAHDITADFKVRNEDAKEMGHLGHFCNAFVSSRLTSKYYAARLGKEQFRPSCQVWEQYQRQKKPSTPIPETFRKIYILAFLLLMIIGHREERLLAILIGVSVILVPTQYIGFRRYVPWLEMLACIAVGCLISFLQTLWRNHARWITIHCAMPIVVLGTYQWLLGLCDTIDRAFAFDNALSVPGVQAIVDKKESNLDLGRLLICSSDARLQHISAVTYDKKPTARVCSLLKYFPMTLVGNKYPQGVLLYKQRLPKNATAEERERHERLFVPYTLAVTLPKLVKRRIASLWK